MATTLDSSPHLSRSRRCARDTHLSANLHSWNGFGNLIKGADEPLIHNGELVHRQLRFNHITRHDLEEDLRLALHAEDLATVKDARLERSGAISFIRK